LYSGAYEEFCLLGYNGMLFVESQRNTRRYIPEDRTLSKPLLFLIRTDPLFILKQPQSGDVFVITSKDFN
jgi:hypothetical protein